MDRYLKERAAPTQQAVSEENDSDAPQEAIEPKEDYNPARDARDMKRLGKAQELKVICIQTSHGVVQC